MYNFLLDDEGKHGHGFTSVDELEQVDIGNGDRPRPTFISAKLDPECKQDLIDLLKEFKDCFAWEYYEMPRLDQTIVEYRLPIKPGYQPYLWQNQPELHWLKYASPLSRASIVLQTVLLLGLSGNVLINHQKQDQTRYLA
jgi:hypothetical protein